MKILKHSSYFMLIIAFGSTFFQCKNDKKEQPTETETSMKAQSSITKSEFGKMPDSTIVERYSLKNASGVEMDVITYGGRITSLKVPNKEGMFENIVLGFDNLADYERDDDPFFGALIGRYGNRIAKGKFTFSACERRAENDHYH